MGQRGGGVVAALALLALAAFPVRAQTAAQIEAIEAMAADLTPAEIVERLRISGLSRAEVKDRLRRAGYDPSIADPYFDALQNDGPLEVSGAAEDFIDALQRIGLRLPASPIAAAPSVVPAGVAAATNGVPVDETEDGLPRFGARVFQRLTGEFAPAQAGPVDPGYRLGPGDEVQLVLTGDVQAAYTLTINREGVLVVPDVGQVTVNGLTLEGLRDALFDRLGSVYSGVRRGSDATTQFSVSLGRLRTNQIRVVGEVVRPGAYQVSSVSTVLEALYLAGGPAVGGSFRRIQVLRAGERVATLDLYPYLTEGRAEGDVRLEQGDVVFVPVTGAQVSLEGLVRRSARFELLENEGLPALIRFAGGLLPDARRDRVQVDRILPPADRTAGRDRILLEAPLDEVLAGSADFALVDGDAVQVFEVASAQRARVTIDGSVWRPGAYELRPGTSVASLVERAGGVQDDALVQLIQLRRLDPRDGTRSLVQVDLEANGDQVLLQEFDRVTVFGRQPLVALDSVAVYGYVRSPGNYAMARGMTASDLILMADGYERGADPREVEVVRRDRRLEVDEVESNSYRVRPTTAIPYPDSSLLEYGEAGARAAEAPSDESAAEPNGWVEADFALQPGDEVYVRRLPGFQQARRVTIEGAVRNPGPYGLTRRGERLSSIVERSGGFTLEAERTGLRLLRDGLPVGVDVERALGQPGSLYDPVLQNGDRIVVPVEDNTVLVRGAVLFETRTIYRPGMSLDDAIAAAGGYAPGAARNRVSIEYANGSRNAVRRRFALFSDKPDVRPGSVIFVPESVPEEGFNWDAALSRTLTFLSTFATVYLAVTR
jgi:protein involved in polysaccharide export with SLBB domain